VKYFCKVGDFKENFVLVVSDISF